MVTGQDISEQAKHLEGTLSDKFTNLLENSSDNELCDRKNFAGHITASGTIVHFPSREILLLHHKTLKKWHVPGGHINPEDQSIMKAALREVEEETGIIADQLKPLNAIDCDTFCVEINTHPIPQNDNKNEKEHFHHDFRYIFRYNGDKKIAIDNNESIDYKWVSLSDPYLRQILNQPELEAIVYNEMLNYFETSTNDSVWFNQRRTMMALAKLAEIYKEIGRSDLSRQTYSRLLKVTHLLIEAEGEKFLNNLGRYQYEYAKIVNDTCVGEQMYLMAIGTYKTIPDNQIIEENLSKILEICSSLVSFYVKHDRKNMIEKLCRDLISHYENTVSNSQKFLNIKLCILIKFLNIYESIGDTELILRDIVNAYELSKQNGKSYYASAAKYMVELGDKIENEQEKEDLYIKAIGIYKELSLESDYYLSEIISINEALCGIYIDSERIDYADKLISQNLEIYDQIANNGKHNHLGVIAEYYVTSGKRYYELGDIEKAEQMYLNAIEMLERTGHDNVLINILGTLADIYKDCYFLCQENEIMMKMVDVYRRLINENPNCYISDLANHQYVIWQRHFEQGSIEKSKKAYFDILKASLEYGEMYDEVSPLANIDEKLAEIYDKNENNNLEEYTNPNLMEAYEYIATLSPLYYGEKIAEYQFKMGNLYFKNDEIELAEKMYLAAKEKFEKTYNDEYETPPAILSAIWNLSLIYEKTKRYDMELSILNKGVEFSGYFASVDNNFASESSKFQDALEEAKSKKLLNRKELK